MILLIIILINALILLSIHKQQFIKIKEVIPQIHL